MPGGVAPIVLTNEKLSSRLWSTLLSFQTFIAIIIIVILAVSSLISFQDFIFVLLSIFYVFFIAKVAFPTLQTNPEPPVFAQHKRFLTVYVCVAALIGLVLPVVYIIQGVLQGDKEGISDKEGIKAAAPHVFLLTSQVFMERVTFSCGFSLPIKVFVPVFYNAMRMYVILDWAKSEMLKVNEVKHGRSTRLFVGKSLSIANMVFWGFNLFGFLLPLYLPKAFRKYYAASSLKNKES